VDAGGRSEGGESVWWLAVAGLFVLLLVPFFFVDVPPVLDYPNHLARLYVLAFGAGDPVLSAMYTPHWRIVPNLVLDLIGPSLMHLLPVHVAGRILLAGAAVLPVVGVLLYHRAIFGRGSYWPLASGLVAYNGIFFFGFINLLYGVGLAFAAAAFWIRFIDRRPVVAVAGAMVAVAGLFFCHLFGFFLFALLAGAHEIAGLAALRSGRSRLRRHALARALMLALALLPGLVLYRMSTLSGVDGDLAWPAPAEKLLNLLSPFMTYSQSLTLLSGVLVVSAFILLRRWTKFDAGTVIAIAATAALYIVAPSQMKSGTFIDARLPIMVALMIFGGSRPQVPRPVARVLFAGGAALLAVRVGAIAAVWHDHGRDLAELRATYAPVEPGARVLVLDAAGDASPAYIAAEPAGRRVPGLFRMDEHLAGLMLIERHAFWPFLFADPRQQPLEVRLAYAGSAYPLGEPLAIDRIAEDRPTNRYHAPFLDNWPARFDYVLLLNAGATNAAAVRPDRLTLLNASDMAALYRVRHP
jgi:hypothetical protein